MARRHSAGVCSTGGAFEGLAHTGCECRMGRIAFARGIGRPLTFSRARRYSDCVLAPDMRLRAVAGQCGGSDGIMRRQRIACPSMLGQITIKLTGDLMHFT